MSKELEAIRYRLETLNTEEVALANEMINLCDCIANLEAELHQASNIASCLANGIIPD